MNEHAAKVPIDKQKTQNVCSHLSAGRRLVLDPLLQKRRTTSCLLHTRMQMSGAEDVAGKDVAANVAQPNRYKNNAEFLQ